MRIVRCGAVRCFMSTLDLQGAVRCGAVSVRCFVSRGARGAVFRDARGDRTARGARGAPRAVCAVRFFVTPFKYFIKSQLKTSLSNGRMSEKYYANTA